jgi:hypothetical protein
VLGLATIVGSGGGVGFLGSICDTYPESCVPPPPVPTAAIQPPYVTALVGATVSYSVETQNITGQLSYHWGRSSDGGLSFVPIAGATAASYTLAGVNLTDDGAVFQVVVTGGTGAVKVPAFSHLAVSATPGVVFQDTEFASADWVVSSVPDPGQLPFVHTEEQVETGGNPGRFRAMTFQLPQGAGAARLFFSTPSAVYDPAVQGEIRLIDYAEDCIALQPSETTDTMSGLVIEQSGRRFVSNTSEICIVRTWKPVAARASMGVQDFRLFDGPACKPDETCLDFSATAPPLHFGYWRISFGAPGDSISHGIDNWKVTVWRK